MKSRMTTMTLWSIAWALAIIGSAILFKGNSMKEWIQAALFIGAITFVLWQSPRISSSSGKPDGRC